MSYDCDGRSLRLEDRVLEGDFDFFLFYGFFLVIIIKSLVIVFWGV